MTLVDRRTLLAAGMAGTLAPAAALAADDTPPAERFALWPGAPTDLSQANYVYDRSTDPAVRDRAMERIRVPVVDVFPAARPNGAAVLIAPGGGYERVVLDKEGYELARWLAARGVSAFVLFYRLPAEGWERARDVPLADAQRAMRLIRANAAKWQVDSKRVAALGFSAGGHVCASLATGHGRRAYAPVDAADALDARPMLAAPIYPVVSMDRAITHAGSRERLIGADAPPALEAEYSPDRNVSAATPPIFLVHAEDDDVVPVENAVRFRAALVAAKLPVETHLFEAGGHGFGLRHIGGRPIAAWPDLFLGWARTHGLLGAG